MRHGQDGVSILQRALGVRFLSFLSMLADVATMFTVAWQHRQLLRDARLTGCCGNKELLLTIFLNHEYV